MSFTNSYKQDSPVEPGYGPDPYDINWMMPLHETALESDRVKLTPFIPSLYARPYAEQVKAHPDIHRYYPIDLTSLDKILLEIETLVRRRPAYILFAIIDKARGDAFAGVIGLIRASPANLSIEIGWIAVFPEFRRTYATSNAVGLLLNYCLELPSAPPERRGLGFRRVQWSSHPENQPSIALAKRMGFKEEGVQRWTMVVPQVVESNGIPLRDGDPKSPSPGCDSAVLSHCADDWENGGRELVRHMIDRL
ncbi:acyl-CoA N-acyltransferase [Russula aff. rugulosa BPL654]|nr:acyl-CoA N-acyltransferase [Russula aff. rugulosa BPL654]